MVIHEVMAVLVVGPAIMRVHIQEEVAQLVKGMMEETELINMTKLELFAEAEAEVVLIPMGRITMF